MNLIGTALAGIYVVVASRSASATSGKRGRSAGAGGEDITCQPGATMNYAVSQPDTTVTVACPGNSAFRGVSETPGNDIYVDANCSKPGVLADVCPGATVSPPQQAGKIRGDQVQEEEMEEEEVPSEKTTVTLRFPQLPASQQIVCVKCPDKSNSRNTCKAVITVAAAPPQGPQACAVGGTSITLEINKAGGSAQFACGTKLTLAPTDPTKAYADDCSTVETLKDMARSAGPKDGYVTVKADKLKKKKLCYLCQPSTSGPQQRGGKDDSCKVYVQVSGSTKFYSSVAYGLALPCLAAMLRFT